MTIPTTPSFSRSGRSGPGGKHTERISTDVSESLLCDIADAQELFREQSPTATRAEVVRMILEEDLHGCIGSLARTFPAAHRTKPKPVRFRNPRRVRNEPRC